MQPLVIAAAAAKARAKAAADKAERKARTSLVKRQALQLWRSKPGDAEWLRVATVLHASLGVMLGTPPQPTPAPIVASSNDAATQTEPQVASDTPHADDFEEMLPEEPVEVHDPGVAPALSEADAPVTEVDVIDPGDAAALSEADAFLTLPPNILRESLDSMPADVDIAPDTPRVEIAGWDEPPMPAEPPRDSSPGLRRIVPDWRVLVALDAEGVCSAAALNVFRLEALRDLVPWLSPEACAELKAVAAKRTSADVRLPPSRTSTRPAVAPSLPAPPPPKCRRITTRDGRAFDRGGSTLGSRATRAAPVVVESSAPSTREEEAGKERVAEELWQTMLALAPRCGMASRFADAPGDQASEVRALILEEWMAASIGHLRRVHRTISRLWNATRAQRASLHDLTYLDVALFLRAARRGGPTAAQGLKRTLGWIQPHWGLTLPLDDTLVVRQARPPASHCEQPAMLMPLGALLALEDAALLGNPYVAFIVSALMAVALGPMRFAHTRRGRHRSTSSWWSEFLVSQGKRRIGGERAPLWVRAPRRGLLGFDWVSAMLRTLELTFGQVQAEWPAYLFPSPYPRRASLLDLRGFERRPLERAHFQRLLRELMGLLGVEGSVIVETTTYSARRVLPTVADAADLTTPQRIHVGSWQGGEAQRALAMPRRYSAVDLAKSAEAKHTCIVCIQSALSRMRLDADAVLSWESLLGHFPVATIASSWAARLTSYEESAARGEKLRARLRGSGVLSDPSGAAAAWLQGPAAGGLLATAASPGTETSSSESTSASDSEVSSAGAAPPFHCLLTKGGGGRLLHLAGASGSGGSMCGQAFRRYVDLYSLPEAVASTAALCPACREHAGESLPDALRAM